MQLTLSAEEYEQLGSDLGLIAGAAQHNAENVSKTMYQQLVAYEYYFRGAYDVGPGEAEWPKPLDHTTAHQSSCDRCGKIDATVRVREIVPLPLDSRLLAVSMSLMGSRLEWRCDDCGDTPIRIVRTEVLIDA